MVDGKCRCGNLQFKIALPHALKEYQPRACDCDFCVERNIHYLSDPAATLFIVKSEQTYHQQQGNRQAQFITCSNCDDVIAVIYQNGAEIKGAANAQLLADRLQLGDVILVSPKQLTAAQKISRWQELWMNVVFE